MRKTTSSDTPLGYGVVLRCNPVPASRPRVTRWGTYYGKTYKAWRELADRELPAAPRCASGHLHVELEFAVRRPKTTKRTNPRGDVDNYAKAMLDAMTKKNYWGDDDQIVSLLCTKRFTSEGEEPFIAATIHELETD